MSQSQVTIITVTVVVDIFISLHFIFRKSSYAVYMQCVCVYLSILFFLVSVTVRRSAAKRDIRGYFLSSVISSVGDVGFVRLEKVQK